MRTLRTALRSARRLLFRTVAGVISMCAGVSAMRDPRSLFRLPSVPGTEPGKTNDVLVSLPRTGAQRPHHVLYFPGDVQNYRETMADHPDNFQWKCWSLEDISHILSERFPSSYIWIIKPSRMHLHKFSCYDHFVSSNMFGAPKHNTELGAFKQLYSLLVNAFTMAQNLLLSESNKYIINRDYSQLGYSTNGCHPEEGDISSFSKDPTVHLGLPSVKGSLSFTLIGFSKGCVVLNQLLHEMQEAKKDIEISSFLANIESMYWLDGGHSGGSNTWITCPDILKVFAQTGIAVHTHVTPYQVSDSMRFWIGEEHKKFTELLKVYNVMVDSQLHFAFEAPSLENHFRVHGVF
ncbi:mitochondrial protein C2orf69 homolog [Hyla sarda]|uniref:mitochondrial protein C2orf69 homolog n=1 Tax=Hyla sarda TaxID=327740 RepID=UPI0024C22B7D|nr:mitochondrial protein C2orf69 homolog [Hyla sarda]